jgi:hypothetical protein
MKSLGIALVLVLTFTLGCARKDEPKAAVEESAAGSQPRTAAHPETRKIGSACFLETVNRVAPREKPTLRAGTPAVFRGWAVVADAEHPVTPLVDVVLRRVQDGGFEDIYLEMGRMPRPDLSQGDPKRELAGFEGETLLPMPGTYDILVSSGTVDWQTVCRTGSLLVVVD